MTRPTMRFVELKSQDQLDMQTLHRARDRLVGERTALINQLRAILLERGLAARRSTAQAILASLLAKATTMTLRWVLLISPFTHRPSGVSRCAI